MNGFIDNVLFFIPLFISIVGVILFLFGMNWLLLGRHPELGNEKRLPRHLAMLGFTLAGIIVISLVLPVSDAMRNQIITIIGVMLSGVVAFSSTTIVANFMSGIMLRINRPFKTGDFIRVGEHFGRIVERGLLDTEVQSEKRELIALPNTYLITNPIAVVSSSGAIISANLSLGYDVHHSRIEPLLIAAAKEAGLEDPFVQIIELGNYSISYRVSGLLVDVKSMLTMRSNLHRRILDTIHTEGIEIVSPNIMTQRRLGDDVMIIPKQDSEVVQDVESTKVEEIVFDKAEQAEQQEEAVEQLQSEIQELEIQSKSAEGDEEDQIDDMIRQKRKEFKELEISNEEAESAEEKGTPKDL